MFGQPNIDGPKGGPASCRRGPRWRLRLDRSTTATPTVPAADTGGPVVLVLPARNEAATVARIVAEAPASIAGRAVRVLVVDDGSTDATADLARAAGADVVEHSPGRGLGAAVRTGLREAVEHFDAAAVAFCDADGEYRPTELEYLILPILSGEAHYVVGSRFAGTIDDMRPHRRLGNRVLTTLVRWVSRVPVTDGQSGYRALSHDAASNAEIIHDYNYAQVLTLDLLAKGYGYTEVPIRYRFRSHGRSFVRLSEYARRVVPAVLREVNDRSHSDPSARRHRIVAAVGVVSLAAGALLTGCSDDGANVRENGAAVEVIGGATEGGGSVSAIGSGCTTRGATTKTATQTMQVSLDEWTLDTAATAPAGVTRVVVKNFGDLPHGLVLARAASPISLPRKDGGVDLDALPAGTVFRIEAFAPNTICEGTFELTAGTYVVFAPEPASGTASAAIDQGMVKTITVA